MGRRRLPMTGVKEGLAARLGIRIVVNITKAILNVIESIQPFDDLEALHVQDASSWIRTTTDSIFRISKPDKPPKHLVSYFVVVDGLCYSARHRPH